MTDVLDVVGLVALTLCGFLLGPAVGFGVVGVACLLLSWSITRKKRHAAEVEMKRKAPQ